MKVTLGRTNIHNNEEGPTTLGLMTFSTATFRKYSTTLSITSPTIEFRYALMSFMLCVLNKPFMLSVVMLSVAYAKCRLC
jgi:hypothetical protein